MQKNDVPLCQVSVIHEETVNRVREEMLDNEQFERLSMFFKAIGDVTRIKILHSLSKSKMCVCDIAALLGMTESAISHQLRVLKQAMLVKSERQGKIVFYSLSDKHVSLVFENALEHIME